MDFEEISDRVQHFCYSPLGQIIQLAAAIITLILSIKPLAELLYLPVINPPLSTILFAISILVFSTLFNIYILSPKIPQRLSFVSSDYFKLIKKSKMVKILNIVFMEFIEQPKLKEIIKERIKSGAKFEIVITRRIRHPSDTSYLKIRADDEANGNLIHNSNNILFELFLFLLKDLLPLGDNKLTNFQIKEYPYAPIMCMYFFDDKLIFGPYIAKDCHYIPLLSLRRSTIRSDINCAYDELAQHYRILSNPVGRLDKNYISEFCYFDGHNNRSINDLIKIYSVQLNAYLTPDILRLYEDFLIGRSDSINGRSSHTDIECRFDIVIKDILQELKLDSTQIRCVQ